MISKKVLLIAAGVIVIVVVAIILVVLRSRNTIAPTNTSVEPTPLPSVYQAIVTQSDKSYTAEIVLGGVAQLINEPELSRYISVSFNSPIDVMWVTCASGYSLQNPHSTTRNRVVIDPTLGAGIELLGGTDNNLSVTCAKR